MKTQITANVRMVQKYDSAEAKGINVFCEEENEGLNENLLGPVQLVLGGSLDQFSVFEQLYKTNQLPGQIEMTVDVGRGAGGKAKLTILAIKDPALTEHLSNVRVVDGSTGEILSQGANSSASKPDKKPETAQSKTGA